jgi:hypothetical protein
MASRRPPAHPATLHVPISTALKTALELEAWECQLSLNDYVRGLLKRRGRWARTVGAAKYDVMGPASGKPV